VFSSVGGQINDVVHILREYNMHNGTIGVQLGWFEVPAGLITLFQKVNPQIKVVDSAPVMDKVRLVKEPGELANMREAARIAVIGMQDCRFLSFAGSMVTYLDSLGLINAHPILKITPR
jgi:Xaa-Pro aminopeptidase